MSTFQDPYLLLVAYSDGELAAEATAALEAQLATSAELRNRLEDVRALQANLRTHLPAAPTTLDAAHRRLILQIAQPLRVKNWWGISRLAAACLALGMVGLWLLSPSINMVRESARKSSFVASSGGSAFAADADVPPARMNTVPSAVGSAVPADSVRDERQSLDEPVSMRKDAVASSEKEEFPEENTGSAVYSPIGGGGGKTGKTVSAGDVSERRELEAEVALDVPEPKIYNELQADDGKAPAWLFTRGRDEGRIVRGAQDGETIPDRRIDAVGCIDTGFHGQIDGLAKTSDGRSLENFKRATNSPLAGKLGGRQNDAYRAANGDKDLAQARLAPASPPPGASQPPPVLSPPVLNAAQAAQQAASPVAPRLVAAAEKSKPAKNDQINKQPQQQLSEATEQTRSDAKPRSIARLKENAEATVTRKSFSAVKPAPLPTAIPLSDVIDSGYARLRDVRAHGYQYRVTGDSIDILPGTDPRPGDPTATFGLSGPDFHKAFGTEPMVVTQDTATLTCAFTADTASFDRAATLLRQGQMVDATSIQAEHFVNATPLEYPPANGPEAFSLYAEAGPSPFAVGDLAPRTALVSIGAVARPAGPDERRPLALTLAIDCSGSMAQPGGLERIQSGLQQLVTTLGDDDTVALVAFGDRARIVLPATPGAQRERLQSAIANLQTGGSTNVGEGLSLAYQLAAERAQPGHESRVLLATDGATLAGDGAASILERIAADRARGISLIVVGCGEQQNAGAALDALAAKGDGQHVYVGSNDEARELFRTKLLPAKIAVLARDAKVQVTWNPQRVSHARLIGYETRRLKAQDFRDDRVDAGEIAHDTQATALFEVILTEGGSGPLGSAAVRYFDTRLEQVRELSCPLPGSVVQARISPRLRLLACSADLADLLACSFWANQRCATYARLLVELERCPPSAFRDRLRTMAIQAQDLTGEP